MNRDKGFTLIEIIIFIMLISVLAVGVVIPFLTLLAKTPTFYAQTQALQLAERRMNLILAQRYLNSFNGLFDPCTSGTPPPICTIPTGYNIVAAITICTTPAPCSNNNDYKKITVTVSGKSHATLSTLVAGY